MENMQITYSPYARRQMKKLPPQDQQAIRQLLATLREWPNDDAHIIQLSGRDDFRLRKGRYRIVFEVYEEEGEIYLTHIGLRDEKTYAPRR